MLNTLTIVKPQKHYKIGGGGSKDYGQTRPKHNPKFGYFLTGLDHKCFMRREHGGPLINSPFFPGLSSYLIFIIFSELPSPLSLNFHFSLHISVALCFSLFISLSLSLSLSEISLYLFLLFYFLFFFHPLAFSLSLSLSSSSLLHHFLCSWFQEDTKQFKRILIRIGSRRVRKRTRARSTKKHKKQVQEKIT